MNDVSIKHSCPCGATFEISGDVSNWIRFRKQADAWQKLHEDCLPPPKPRVELALLQERPNETITAPPSITGEWFSCWLCKKQFPGKPAYTSPAINGPFHYCSKCNPLRSTRPDVQKSGT